MSIYDLAYKIELYGGAYKIKHGHNERWRQKALRRAPLGDSGTGRLAQRESTVFTRRGPLVQTQQRPPFCRGLGGRPLGPFSFRTAHGVTRMRKEGGFRRLDNPKEYAQSSHSVATDRQRGRPQIVQGPAMGRPQRATSNPVRKRHQQARCDHA